MKIDSLSAGLILGNTLFRNQTGIGNKVVGAVGYALIAVVSLIETLVVFPFLALSILVYPLDDTPFDYYCCWIGSSAFVIGWSLADLVLNLFNSKLIADEESARTVLRSGNIFWIPKNAVI